LKAIPALRAEGRRRGQIRERLAKTKTRALHALVAHAGRVERAGGPGPTGRPGASALRAPRAESVTRFVLAPGVELLVDTGAERAVRGRLAELVQTVQRILNAGGARS